MRCEGASLNTNSSSDDGSWEKIKNQPDSSESTRGSSQRSDEADDTFLARPFSPAKYHDAVKVALREAGVLGPRAPHNVAPQRIHALYGRLAEQLTICHEAIAVGLQAPVRALRTGAQAAHAALATAYAHVKPADVASVAAAAGLWRLQGLTAAANALGDVAQHICGGWVVPYLPAANRYEAIVSASVLSFAAGYGAARFGRAMRRGSWRRLAHNARLAMHWVTPLATLGIIYRAQRQASAADAALAALRERVAHVREHMGSDYETCLGSSYAPLRIGLCRLWQD